jgi:MFS family permease
MLAIGANSTAIMAALPQMRAELSLSPAGLQWAVNAYLLVSAASIVLGGQAADRFGARQASLFGLAIFAVASSLIAVAFDQTALLLGRGLQGLAAAFAVPGTLAAVSLTAPANGKSTAIAAWAGFLMLGFSIGPLVGGTLTHVTGWRLIFWLNLGLMLAAMLGLAPGWARRLGAPDGQGRSLDWLGLLLLATLMVSLVLALDAAPHATSAPFFLVGPLLLAAIAFFLLRLREARVAAPFIDLKFFARSAFLMGVSLGSLAMFSTISFLLYFNLFAQSREGLGFTALQAGVTLLPLSAALLALALTASAVAARLGLRNAITAAMGLIAAACLIIGIAVAGDGFLVLAIGLSLLGAGLAVPYALAPRLALSVLTPAQAGRGSGIVNACTFLGGSLGVAGGAGAMALAGFPGVLMLIALAGLLGAGLSRALPGTST